MYKVRAFIAAAALVVASGFVAATPASAHSGTHRFGPIHGWSDRTQIQTVATISLLTHRAQGYSCSSLQLVNNYWVFTCR